VISPNAFVRTEELARMNHCCQVCQIPHFQGVWSGLSDGLKSYLSKRVASISLCDGDYVCLVISVIQQIYIQTPPVINAFKL
jgi:hypothetical protein